MKTLGYRCTTLGLARHGLASIPYFRFYILNILCLDKYAECQNPPGSSSFFLYENLWALSTPASHITSVYPGAEPAQAPRDWQNSVESECEGKGQGGVRLKKIKAQQMHDVLCFQYLLGKRLNSLQLSSWAQSCTSPQDRQTTHA